MAPSEQAISPPPSEAGTTPSPPQPAPLRCHRRAPPLPHKGAGGGRGLLRTGTQGDPIGLVGLALLLTIALPGPAGPAVGAVQPDRRRDGALRRADPGPPARRQRHRPGSALRAIYGARVSLLIGVLAALVATVVGTTVGLVAGFFRGLVNPGLMRFVDVLLALPFLPLMIVLGVYVGPGLVTEILVIGAVIWARTAREIRSQVSLVARAQLRGGGPRDGRPERLPADPGISRRPGATGDPAAWPGAANIAILLEASLSFLGLGDPAAKSWGTTLDHANARSAFPDGCLALVGLPPGLLHRGRGARVCAGRLRLEERARPHLSVREWRFHRSSVPARNPSSASAAGRRPGRSAAGRRRSDGRVRHANGASSAPSTMSASRSERGEALGVVGESGQRQDDPGRPRSSGCFARRPRSFRGRDRCRPAKIRRPCAATDLQRLRGKTVALVPQSAMNALEPCHDRGDQVRGGDRRSSLPLRRSSRAPASPSCWGWSASRPSGPTPTPTSLAAACASGWSSRWRWRTTRT